MYNEIYNLTHYTMNNNQIAFLVTIALFGIPVILSYIFGLKRIKNIEILWGGMPKKVQKILTISMLLCTVSFFTFSSYIFILNGGNVDLIFIDLIYAVLLGAAALWMPLMIKVIESKKKIYWILTRISLAIVGFTSLFFLSVMIFYDRTGIHYIASIIGLTIFTFHTGILDAIVWPYFFTKKKEVGNVNKR